MTPPEPSSGPGRGRGPARDAGSGTGTRTGRRTPDEVTSARLGRRLALASLFEAEFGQRTAAAILERHLAEGGADEPTAEFGRKLVANVVDNRDRIDALIEQVAPQYPVVQLARMDRTLLRSGIGEVDSFTDAMTLPAELSWPARLAGLLGVSVHNYGTAGFGPGQELLVLKEYVLARKPRRVVVGFFAGNDLHDAESFEASGQHGAVSPIPAQGWKFKDVIARYDEFYVMSLYKGVAALLRDRDRDRADRVSSQVDYSGEDLSAPAATRPGFDRGLFTVPVAGRTLRFAFLPPYLDRLELSREQLQASPGWEVTRRSYQEMERLVRAQGGQLVVAFIPSKAQVYLPLLSASFSPAELQQALRFCLRDRPSSPSLDAMMRNRLALNDLMRDFCAAEGIAFLDLTAVLQTKLEAGYNTYFPDDSHWNAAGHEAAAGAIASFMRERGL